MAMIIIDIIFFISQGLLFLHKKELMLIIIYINKSNIYKLKPNLIFMK